MRSVKEGSKTDTLKKSILQGVLEDNKQIGKSCPDYRSFKSSLDSRILPRLLSVLVVTLVFVLTYFISDPVRQEILPEQAVTPAGSTLPWGRIILAQSSGTRSGVRHHPGLSVLEGSDIDRSEVHFDANLLLNYDFLLNQDHVRLSSVFGLEVQTIVIDPGHGGRDPGAIGSEGTLEKNIVLDIATHLRDLLIKSGRYRVFLTRENDSFVSLANRVEFSNLSNADLFISLHINALPQKEYNVTETFYFGPPSDSYTLQLAEQENRGSKIKTGDFKNIIKKIGDVLKEQESSRLASTLQHSLFTNMEKYDRVIGDNGIKIAPFVVLLGVDAPSVLVEISCISKKEEELNLNDPTYRRTITTALEKGITSYLNQRNRQVLKGDDNGNRIFNKSS